VSLESSSKPFVGPSLSANPPSGSAMEQSSVARSVSSSYPPSASLESSAGHSLSSTSPSNFYLHTWITAESELEMGYLRQSLERQSGAKGHQVMMIHSAVSNVGRNWDGVAGGDLPKKSTKSSTRCRRVVVSIDS
jgi:hypothetical protein